MKTSVIRLFSLALAVMPLMAAAQSNIKAAFDAIIKCPDAEITESHTLDRDPVTGIKTGQSDVYRYVLPAGKLSLLKNVVSAFEKDADMAYSVNRGKSVNTESDIVLTVGNNGNDGVYISSPADCEYIYSLYLAPPSEDPNGIYRYAYGMNFKETANGKLAGKLIITYATTLQYRQKAERERQFDVLRSFSNGVSVLPSSTQTSQETWFDTLMSYFQGMTSANTQTRIALATKAFNVIKKTGYYSEVTEADKEAVREILAGMISDKKYSESVLSALLNQCLVALSNTK